MLPVIVVANYNAMRNFTVKKLVQCYERVRLWLSCSSNFVFFFIFFFSFFSFSSSVSVFVLFTAASVHPNTRQRHTLTRQLDL